MAILTDTPRTLSAARAALDGRNRRRIGNNTELRMSVNGNVYASLHGNDIVRYTVDGVEVSWAGYVTITTSDRLNQLAPGKFTFKKGVPHHNGEPMPARDWVRV